MIDVTCAIIRKDRMVLTTRRSHGQHLAGMWEFPGGKIEPGETAEECIIREIREELNVEIVVIRQLDPVEYHYPEKSIRLIPFVCEIVSGDIVLSGHSEYRWLEVNELFTVEWATADVIVVKNYIFNSI